VSPEPPCDSAAASPRWRRLSPTGAGSSRRWKRLIERQVDGGTQALVVAGSTGEAAALFDIEFEAAAADRGRTGRRAHPGARRYRPVEHRRTIEQTRRAAALGADAALVVTPPYVRPTQAGLLAHYRAVADDGGLPVVLYNVPGAPAATCCRTPSPDWRRIRASSASRKRLPTRSACGAGRVARAGFVGAQRRRSDACAAMLAAPTA
jgi:hypothetical protein